MKRERANYALHGSSGDWIPTDRVAEEARRRKHAGLLTGLAYWYAVALLLGAVAIVAMLPR